MYFWSNYFISLNFSVLRIICHQIHVARVKNKAYVRAFSVSYPWWQLCEQDWYVKFYGLKSFSGLCTTSSLSWSSWQTPSLSLCRHPSFTFLHFSGIPLTDVGIFISPWEPCSMWVLIVCSHEWFPTALWALWWQELCLFIYLVLVHYTLLSPRMCYMNIWRLKVHQAGE